MAEIRVQPWCAPDGASASGIWQVVISHPERLNAMTRAMWQQLRQAFEQLQQRSDVRCIVVQGEGEAFCAGGDISEYPDFRFTPAGLHGFHEGDVWGALQAMLACDVPIVASIAGACMGAGVEIASCCDVRWAADNAKFGAPIAKLGFPMAPKEMQLLSQVLDGHMVRRMLLEAAVFDANQMAAAGFIAGPVTGPELHLQVARSALRIASWAPQAARLTKQSLRALACGQAVRDPFAYADTAEHREGIDAFLHKRAPQFA